MTEPQILALSLSLALLVGVIELVRRRVLVEEHSFIWLALAVVSLAASASPSLLAAAGRWLGLARPPWAILLFLLLVVTPVALFLSVVLSRLSTRVDRLVEEQALLAARLREAEQGRGRADGSGDPAPPRMARER